MKYKVYEVNAHHPTLSMSPFESTANGSSERLCQNVFILPSLKALFLRTSDVVPS